MDDFASRWVAKAPVGAEERNDLALCRPFGMRRKLLKIWGIYNTFRQLSPEDSLKPVPAEYV